MCLLSLIQDLVLLKWENPQNISPVMMLKREVKINISTEIILNFSYCLKYNSLVSPETYSQLLSGHRTLCYTGPLDIL